MKQKWDKRDTTNRHESGLEVCENNNTNFIKVYFRL